MFSKPNSTLFLCLLSFFKIYFNLNLYLFILETSLLNISLFLFNSSILKSRFTMSSDMLVIGVLSFLLIFFRLLSSFPSSDTSYSSLHLPFHLWLNQSLIKSYELYLHQLKVFRCFHSHNLINYEKILFPKLIYSYEVLDKYIYLLQQIPNKLFL